jgi:hypothetical protein
VGSNRRELPEKESERVAQTMVRRQDNARRAQVAFGRLCSANFDGSEIAIFATLTFREEKSIQDGYALFHVFTVRLRQHYNPSVRYIAVPERGTRNTKRLHFHALFWGLPVEEIKRERETRTFAKVWQYGYVDLVVTNNDVKVGFYLAKYLSKAYQDPQLFKSRSYVASKNIRRPEIFTDFASLILEYEYGDDAKLVRSKTYDTHYLGKCEYKVFELDTPPQH